MSQSWLSYGSPVKRPNYVTQGWAKGRPDSVGGVHHGLDFRAAVGDPAYAVYAGVVEYARRDPESTAGNWVGIRHEGEMLSRYIHLSKVLVEVGQLVTKGQLIGLTGQTGLAAGPHLHFDLLLPATRLPEYTALFGKPLSGFGELTDFGYKVPGEPIIPVDEYSQAGVVTDARLFHIPLYPEVGARLAMTTERRANLGVGVAAAGVVALGLATVFYVLSSRS